MRNLHGSRNFGGGIALTIVLLHMAEQVGAIIENPGFLPNYSAFKNLKFLAGLTGKVTDERIKEVIC